MDTITEVSAIDSVTGSAIVTVKASGAETEPDELMVRVYHPGSLVTRLVDAYITRLDIVISTVTGLFKTLKDTSQRETLAKRLKEATSLKAEILSCKERPLDPTLELLRTEIKQCGTVGYVNIHDVYNREATMCQVNVANSFAFDVKALAREYLRIEKLADAFNVPVTSIVSSSPTVPIVGSDPTGTVVVTVAIDNNNAGSIEPPPPVIEAESAVVVVDANAVTDNYQHQPASVLIEVVGESESDTVSEQQQVTEVIEAESEQQ